jgi:hypothetical protein
MKAMRMAEKLRRQNPGATTDQLKTMISDPEYRTMISAKQNKRMQDAVNKRMQDFGREGGDPNADAVQDPMRVLENYHEGFFVPPGTPEQQQAYKDAIDRRLYSQPLRERRRDALEATGTTDAVRRRIADVVKPASMAASLTPFDMGLGDLAYAGGELIDPEGTYGDAAMAAAGGILTGGLGSGAIFTAAAKEARERAMEEIAQGAVPKILTEVPDLSPDIQRAIQQAKARNPNANIADLIQAAKRGVDRARKEIANDFEDLIPTQIKPFPPSKTYGPVQQPPPGMQRSPYGGFERKKKYTSEGVEYDPVGSSMAYGMLRDQIQKSSKPARDRSKIDSGDLGTASAMIGAGMGGALLMREVNKAMMEDVRNSSDYGNAFSETTRMSSPDMFDAADNLNDVPMMLQQAQLKAAGIFEQTGSVPSSIKREIGKLEALMNTKNSMDAADDRVLEDNLFQPSEFNRMVNYASMADTGFNSRLRARAAQPGFNIGFEDVMDNMADREVRFKPSRPVVENPYLGPEEAPTVGPPDPTPAQMRAMTDEIEPAMEDFGE